MIAEKTLIKINVSGAPLLCTVLAEQMFSWQLRLIDLCSNHPCVPGLIMHTRLWWPDKLRQRACLHPGLHTGGRIYRVCLKQATTFYNPFVAFSHYPFFLGFYFYWKISKTQKTKLTATPLWFYL
jgi:hypothetical protein